MTRHIEFEGQQRFPIGASREKLVFPIELRRDSPFKIVPDELRSMFDQLGLDIKRASMEAQPEEAQGLEEKFQRLCESLSWEKNKLPVKTRVTFAGNAYGYYCKIHPGKFVVTAMEDPNNPGQELTIVLAKSAFKKPAQGKRVKPVQEEIREIDAKEDRRITRREKRIKETKAQTIVASPEELSFMERSVLNMPPGTKYFTKPPEKPDGQKKAERAKDLRENADWTPDEQSTVALGVTRGSVLPSEAHWFLCRVKGLTDADKEKENKDHEKLKEGDFVYVSLGDVLKGIKNTPLVQNQTSPTSQAA
jgi:hypothetical protein